MKLIFCIFLVYLLASFVGSLDGTQSISDTGYYWRDYNGIIPNDAFRGGRDVDGGPIYIGQTYGKFLIPSQIYGSSKKNFYELASLEHETTKQVKILCTRNPEQLEWIETNTEKLKKQSRVNLVNGGFEPGCNTYIGRAAYHGRILVGKVLADNIAIYTGFWTTLNRKSLHFTASFEILSFNKNSPKVKGVYGDDEGDVGYGVM